MQLVLASQSPRRKELLALLGHAFTIDAPTVDETIAPGTPPPEAVQQLALCKAKAVAPAHPNSVIIGADTIVVLDTEILGKPKDTAQATAMLTQLQGRSHTVYTGVALVQGGRQTVFVSASQVQFYPLTSVEIAAYIATGEPMDKAGAYGIQGKGALFVKSISGDFFSIMGLPVASLSRALQNFTKDL